MVGIQWSLSLEEDCMVNSHPVMGIYLRLSLAGWLSKGLDSTYIYIPLKMFPKAVRSQLTTYLGNIKYN